MEKKLFDALVFLTLLAPLVSFFTLCCLPRNYIKIILSASIFLMLISTLSALVLLFNFWNGAIIPIHLNWFSIGTNSFTADLALSNRSLVMLALVAFISLLVHVFSIGYMGGDRDLKRYFAMLGFFTFCMQGIVLSDNLLLLFMFWELVGFSSYLLIGHRTIRPEAGRAAKKAFLLNRIGDAGFMVGLMMIWAIYETFSLTQILSTSTVHPWQTAASLCIFCGVIGKSAQFPLFTWLPDAMEGPTPVSALIHAATMVAAGVYLLVRLFHIFTEDSLLVVAVTGMITTLIGAMAALSQHDIKKILAYSTISQLGLMVLAIGMGILDAALLHLFTHAFFKACLFLSAGLVTHSLHKAQKGQQHFDVQDIRNMGGLRKKMPTAFIAFLLSGASLAGIPFFSGFLSKEAILIALYMHNNILSWLMLVVIVSVSFLTVLYTFRMIWFIFFGEGRVIKPLKIEEPSWIMRLPVLILAFCSLWFLVSRNPFDFKGWMLTNENHHSDLLWITFISILWIVAAVLVSWYAFRKNPFKTHHILRKSFYIDEGLTAFFGTVTRISSRTTAFIDRSWIDKTIHGLVYAQVVVAHFTGWIDHVFVDGTVNGVARLAGLGGKITRSFQGGNIQLYIFWALFAIIIFIIWTLN